MKFLKDGCGRKREVHNMIKSLFHISCLLLFYSCVAQKQLKKNPSFDRFVNDTSFRSAHIGVSIYDPSTRKYLYDHQGEKYFVPASNIKIITCYAAMKYLKHILPGIRYYENDTAIYLLPTGDPTFLHRDFLNQPVVNFLKHQQKKIYITDRNWKEKELGKGWSWDDFNDEYMTERNALPVYGNTLKWVQEKVQSNSVSLEESFSIYSDPEVSWKVRFETDASKKQFKVERDRLANIFRVTEGTESYKEVFVPFMVNGLSSALGLLPDTIGKSIRIMNNFVLTDPQQHVIGSQPTDSVLRPMMYRSDNFFAEQLLLMVSEERLGIMNDERITDTILQTDLKRAGSKPVWVDGSGLSRYNLFSPRDLVGVLDKMRVEFGMERLKAIFPTGDSGTLKGYFIQDNGKIYAKTGSMSGVLALSGFMYTKKNRLLIFSVLLNNYIGTNVNARRLIEKFLQGVRGSE